MFRPAIKLLAEILETKTYYNRWPGLVLWLGTSFVVAPYVILVMLTAKNSVFIEDFASSTAMRFLEEEEDDE